jgi:cytochrome bd ubiquinol oxidase subunit II
VAAAGLVVLRFDARSLFDDLVGGAGLPALIVSVVAGVATLALVRARHYEPARFAGALAVAAIIAGWGLAQSPDVLPGLTIDEAAAGRPTLWATIIATLLGSAILFPSLGLLFGLLLRGRFDPGAEHPAEAAWVAEQPAPRPPRATLIVAGVIAVGAVVTVFGPGWSLAVGVVLMLGGVAAGVLVLLEPDRL